MKTSTPILSKELGLPAKGVLSVLNAMISKGLLIKTISKEGMVLQFTEKAKVLLSSSSQALCRETQCIPQSYRAYSIQILYLIKSSC